jgi:hypothetical protein
MPILQGVAEADPPAAPDVPAGGLPEAVVFDEEPVPG